jgi:periplasmic protein TonB
VTSDLIEQKPSRRLWIFAGVCALALHIGGAALAIVHLQTDDGGDDSLGAQGIEVGLEMASPRAEVTELPPGPDVDASAASAAMAEQKAVEKETDLPKDVATESDDPDRIVTANDSKKPVEDELKPAAVQTTASQESAAHEATAQQVYENAKESEKPTVVNQGLGKDRQRLSAEWGRRLSAHFKNHQIYPDKTSNKEMKVTVHLALNRLGKVLSVGIVESSGNRFYDEAALSMIRRSDPVPRPPAKLTDERFEYDLPVTFDKPKS